MTWTPLARLTDLADATRLTAGAVTLIRNHDTWHAIASRCPHMGYPMEKSTLRDGVVTCAWHQWEFDLATGGCYRGACADLPVYPLRIVDGQVQVDLAGSELHLPVAALGRLRDRLLEGDPYQIARSLAECLEHGLSPQDIARAVAEHGFAHAIAAHRSAQATAELSDVVEGARCAELFGARDRILPLLHGTLMVGAGVGSRPAVMPLPHAGTASERTQLLDRYIEDPSALAIERLLCDWPASDEALPGRLLELAAHPRFLPAPGVFIDLIDALDVAAWLGTTFHSQRAALIAWILGQRRGDPSVEERAAIGFLERHLPTLPDASPAMTTCTLALLAPVSTAASAEEALAHVWGLLTRVPVAPLSVIDCFAQLEARRLAKLRPNNGGLWGTPVLGIRQCDAWARAAPQVSHRTLVLGALHCAWHAFTSRWLAQGEPWDEAPAVATGPSLSEAFSANEVDAARSAAVTLAQDARQPGGSWAPVLKPLLEEDLEGGRLRFLAAVLRSQARQEEWQPWIAGAVSHALDQRGSHDRSAAARFGRSMLARKAGAAGAASEV